MAFREVLLSVVVAIAAGGLVGAERQQAQAGAATPDFGGIRTFPLVALLGAIGALLRPVAGPWLLLGLLGAVTAIVAVTHARTVAADPGISSEVAAIVTFALGVLAGERALMPDSERFLLVGAIAALTMAMLALKRPLHGFIAAVSTEDIFATAKFVVLAAVVLPTLPDRALGPFGALNPFKIGAMTALIAGISFTGYVAARALGTRRGILVTGLAGGLVSSTAVTLTYAGRARKDPSLVSVCAVTIIAASSTMFARVLVVISALDRPLLARLAAVLGGMALAGATIGTVVLLRERRGSAAGADTSMQLRNPFELSKAVQFGVLYGVVQLVAKAAEHYLGSRGVYVSSFFAGLTDVDAITLSIVEMHRGGLDARTAIFGILIAVATNTLVKISMAWSIGGRPLGIRVGGALGAALVVGVGALVAIAR